MNYHQDLQWMISIMWGLWSSKTNKPDIPLRPIISGFGAAPHNIAKLLPKVLFFLFAIISEAHIKKFGSLLKKLIDIDMKNKSLRTRFRTPVALLRSLSGKYPWERYEPLILPAMG